MTSLKARQDERNAEDGIRLLEMPDRSSGKELRMGKKPTFCSVFGTSGFIF